MRNSKTIHLHLLHLTRVSVEAWGELIQVTEQVVWPSMVAGVAVAVAVAVGQLYLVAVAVEGMEALVVEHPYLAVEAVLATMVLSMAHPAPHRAVVVEKPPPPHSLQAHVVNFVFGGLSDGTFRNHRRRARHKSR